MSNALVKSHEKKITRSEYFPARYIEVEISQCRHFGGFRYGTASVNPYEQFASGLANGRGVVELRSELMGFLSGYRPRTMGELLDEPTLGEVPLWLFPWSVRSSHSGGWHRHASEVPDIITHFSDEGIPLEIVDSEIEWLLRAFNAIRTIGYQPDRFSHIRVRPLVAANSVYIVTDGNHRLAALSALGHTRVQVRVQLGSTRHARNARFWPQVLGGRYSVAEARTLVAAYAKGVDSTTLCDSPADFV